MYFLYEPLYPVHPMGTGAVSPYFYQLPITMGGGVLFPFQETTAFHLHQIPTPTTSPWCLLFVTLLPLQGVMTLFHPMFATSNATASLPQLWYPPKNSQAVSAAWVTPQLSLEGGHTWCFNHVEGRRPCLASPTGLPGLPGPDPGGDVSLVLLLCPRDRVQLFLS